MRWIAGLRVTRDELSFDHSRVSTVPSSVGVRNAIRSSFSSDGSTSETGVSGRIGPQYDFTPNILGFLPIREVIKVLHITFILICSKMIHLSLIRKTANSYELGLKSQWLNNRLRVNVALFNMIMITIRQI